MKVAIATPVLYDPSSPFNHLFKDILGGFLDAGYEIVRYAAVLDRNEEDYRYGYDEIECHTYIRKDSDRSNIISRYIRDTLTGIREARDVKKSGADVLFEDVSYVSYWTVKAAKKKGMRVVAMLQDVWPDNAVQSGLIGKKGLLYRYFESRQRYVYKRADRIICISDDMRDFIVSKGIDGSKIEVIYNWGYSDETVSIPWEDNKFVEKYGIEKDFYAVYAGNIGRMQNVELVVKAAEKLPDVKFLIVGDGARREEIEKRVKTLSNVTMLPLQPPELAEHIYSMAGVNIIPLVEGGAKTAMPSKTGVVLSCGRPVIFCFGSGTRFAQLVEQYGAGTSVSASDENELIRSIELQTRKSNPREDAYNLYKKQFSKSTNICRYVDAMR